MGDSKTEGVLTDASGWFSKEPIHPLRDGHILISEKLTKELQKI